MVNALFRKISFNQEGNESLQVFFFTFLHQNNYFQEEIIVIKFVNVQINSQYVNRPLSPSNFVNLTRVKQILQLTDLKITTEYILIQQKVVPLVKTITASIAKTYIELATIY